MCFLGIYFLAFGQCLFQIVPLDSLLPEELIQSWATILFGSGVGFQFPFLVLTSWFGCFVQLDCFSPVGSFMCFDPFGSADEEEEEE